MNLCDIALLVTCDMGDATAGRRAAHSTMWHSGCGFHRHEMHAMRLPHPIDATSSLTVHRWPRVIPASVATPPTFSLVLCLLASTPMLLMRTVPVPPGNSPAPIAAPISPASVLPLPAVLALPDEASLEASDSDVDDIATALESVRVSDDHSIDSNHEMAVHHNRLIPYTEQRRPASMVCWISTCRGSGTGFLARLGAQRVVITNNHVLEKATSARTATVHFDYHEPDSVIKSRTSIIKLDPFTFFFTDTAHDFTVSAYKDEEGVVADRCHSAYDLTAYSTSLSLPGDSVHVFQHPEGQCLHSSTGKVVRTQQQFVVYDCSTDYGSSGSLVLTSNYELLALHHKRIPEETCNQGVMISSIVGVLLRQLHSFLLDIGGAPAESGHAAAATSYCADASLRPKIAELLEEHTAREAQQKAIKAAKKQEAAAKARALIPAAQQATTNNTTRSGICTTLSPAHSSNKLRCRGTTANNKQCAREFNPTGNQQYCWQHQEDRR